MPASFTPEMQANSIKVPYFEDARADLTPGYATTKSAERLQTDIAQLIIRLGGSGPTFLQGSFGSGREKRYGYEVTFTFGGRPAVMQVAALPIRRETYQKKIQALRHALYTIVEQLKTQIAARIMSPGYEPLVQFLLVPGTGKTVGELVLISNDVPNLNPSLPARVGDVVEGVIVED
ncbi:MAG: hypothetical protein KJ065_09175 [Anaerolineae bacterium]|nr:hypothetical protein [Anaerolineae bacterium]